MAKSVSVIFLFVLAVVVRSTAVGMIGWYTCFQSDWSHIPGVDLVLLEEGDTATATDDDDDDRADERNVPIRKVNAYTIIINIVLLYMLGSIWNRNYVSQGI